MRHGLASHLLYGGQHFLHGVAESRAHVEHIRCAAFQQVFHGSHMRFRQIADVDVVADTGAIRRRVIVAKQRHRLARLDSTQQQRNQMRLRLVALSESCLGL